MSAAAQHDRRRAAPLALVGGGAAARRAAADEVLTALEILLGGGPPGERARALSEHLAQAWACDRVAVLVRGGRGRMRILAVSGGGSIGPRTPLGHRLRHLVRVAADTNTVHGDGTLLALPAPDADGRAQAFLVCERRAPEAAFSKVEKARFSALATRLGPPLAVVRNAARDPVASLRHALSRGGSGRRRRLALAAAAALLAALAGIPAPYQVTGLAGIEGQRQRALVAPMDTYIEAVHVQAGQRIAAGAPVVTFSDQDLRLEQVKWAGERARAVSAQRDAAARQDRAKLRVLEAQIEHASAELERVGARLARRELRAPQAGTIVSGDLSQRLGAPVRRGEILFELVPGDDYRLRLAIAEHDIEDLSPGMRGRVRLNAFPGRELGFELARITPLAEASAEGNHFLAYATLAGPTPPLRPGMSGIAHIDAGTRPLLASWTRSLRLWLTLSWWRWFG